MQHARVFSKGGSYQEIVDSDMLLHKEVIATAISSLSNWLKSDQQPAMLRILDLACGGLPIVPSALMKAFPDRHFDYCGIDINSDQIADAKSHKFSPNVTPRLMQGDSWDPSTWSDCGPFDIVYIGLNIHHAVPEELEYLAQQLHTLIRMGGIFINHDFFRPTKYPYLRRPDHDPKTGISLSLISPERLKRAGYPLPQNPPQTPDWRENFFKPYIKTMKDRGMPQSMIDMTVQHVSEHDYPVTTSEWAKILSQHGFSTQEYAYPNSHEPLRDFFDTVVATRIK